MSKRHATAPLSERNHSRNSARLLQITKPSCWRALSRMHELVFTDPTGKPLPPPPFPVRMIETSSPGIRGQSGGPIFDKNGTIWAIQSSTASYEMDLNTKERQYYHVGVGVHTVTIFGLFKSRNITAQISDY
jgi:hypothetical protein